MFWAEKYCSVDVRLGNWPVKRLFSMLSPFRAVRAGMPRGRDPSNPLPRTFRPVRAVRVVMVSGITPLKLLFWRITLLPGRGGSRVRSGGAAYGGSWRKASRRQASHTRVVGVVVEVEDQSATVTYCRLLIVNSSGGMVPEKEQRARFSSL